MVFLFLGDSLPFMFAYELRFCDDMFFIQAQAIQGLIFHEFFA